MVILGLGRCGAGPGLHSCGVDDAGAAKYDIGVAGVPAEFGRYVVEYPMSGRFAVVNPESGV